MTLRWVAVKARTGEIITDLVGVRATTPLKETLGRSESATVSIPVPSLPVEWEQATLPGYAALIALEQNDAGTDIPVWGGLVMNRTRTARGGTSTVELGLVTAAAYFDRRYLINWAYTGVEQNTLAGDIAARFAGSAINGLPFRIETVTGATNRDRTYLDTDNITVYTALTNLTGVLNGPEWTIYWEAQASPNGYRPVFRSADRIGIPSPAGFSPAAQFYMGDGGSVAAAQTVESYGPGDGANDVMATSSSQNDARPQSPHQVAADDGRPTYEYRWMPSSSIIEIPTLTSHAQRALATLAPGSTVLTMTAQRFDAAGAFVAPRLGIDWWIGDDVFYEIDDPSWPDGLSGIARCIGWQLTEDTVSPILALPPIDLPED